MAIHASTRAQLVPEASVLVFGAGTIGLLISAMSKVAGSNNVVIADAQPNRVAFAVENGFAHRGFVVLHTFGQNIHENLQSAKEIGALAILEKPPNEDLISNGYDTVFECTGAELCTQAAIYVTCSHPEENDQSPNPKQGHAPRRQNRHRRHGQPHPNPTPLGRRPPRNRHRRHLPLRQHVPPGDRIRRRQPGSDTAR